MTRESIYRENPALVGGSPQQVHEQLWSAERARRTRIRIAVAVGLLAVGWKLGRLGLGALAAVLFLVVDLALLIRSRHASSVWRRGQSGADRTARILRLLEMRGFRVLHNRVVPNYGAVQHLVIGTGRVWLVENQVHDPETGVAAVRGRLFVGKGSHAHIVSRLEQTAREVSERLSADLNSPVKAAVIVALHGGRVDSTRMTAGGVALMRPWRIPGFIRQNSKGVGSVPEKITSTALRAFGPSWTAR
ncbi:MAG: nuclease-related domain-containing protein [Streptosporangiaceae bacterium]